MKRFVEIDIVTSGLGLALLTLLGFAVQANSTTASLLFWSLSLSFVLVYYLLHRQILITERNQAEEILRQSEEQLRLALEAAHMGTCDWNILTNQITWSSSHEQLFGLAPGSLERTYEAFVACIHPEDRDAIVQLLNRTRLERHGYYQEWRVVWPDGSIHWIEGKGKFFYDAEGKAVRMVGTVMDISDRKHREEQLRLLESVVVNTSNAVIITDSEPIDQAGSQIFYVNPAFTRITGYSPEEVIGQTPRILQGSKTDRAVLEQIRVAQKTWQPIRVDLINYHKDGSEFWIDLSMVPVANEKGGTYWVWVQRDITARKLAEAALQKAKDELEIRVAARTAELSQANERLQRELFERERAERRLQETTTLQRAILDSANYMIISTAVDGTILTFNAAAQACLGYSPAEVVGTTLAIIHDPEELIRRAQVLSSEGIHITPGFEVIVAKARRGQPDECEWSYIGKHGNRFPVLLSVTALHDAKGNITGFLGIASDITERKWALEALRQAEAKYRSIFENAIEGIFQTTTDGRYITANPMLARIYGYSSPQELIAKICDIGRQLYVDANRRAEFIRLLQKYDIVSAFESQVYRQDGKVIWISEQARAVRDSNDMLLYYEGTVEDITQRKQAEEERAKLTAILEATSDIVATASVDQEIRYLNSAARKVFGFSENEDFTNFTISDTHPDWAYQLLRNEGIPAAMRDGVWIGETAFLSYDGQSIPVSQLLIAHKSPDGSVRQLSTIARDITEQKQIEATLREAERRWRILLENVRLVVVGLDCTSKVEYVNPFFLELVGYTQAEVLGKDWFETFLPPDQRQQARESFLELQKQEFHTHHQNPIVTKAGEERTIAWNNTLLKNLQGDVIGTMSIGEDITERQAIERMKDEFISVVSHELRTPLTSIHGALSLLSSGLIDTQSDKGRRVIEIADQSADRLVRLVNDILDLERLESGKISLLKQLCNAEDLMMKAIDMMQVMANLAGITLSVSLQPVQLNADPDRIIQVLMNLLGNAIKFSPRDSTVCLSVKFLCEDHIHKEFTTNANSKQILFQVKDQGRGIPADKLESIFERFHQVDGSDSRKKGGTGLGLAICRSIVQQHGGQIWVESTLGQGSSFYFCLPGWAVEDNIHDDQANIGD